MDEILARILRRFLTENEPGYDSAAYAAIGADTITLDGTVTISEEEEKALMWIVRGEDKSTDTGACYG